MIEFGPDSPPNLELQEENYKYQSAAAAIIRLAEYYISGDTHPAAEPVDLPGPTTLEFIPRDESVWDKVGLIFPGVSKSGLTDPNLIVQQRKEFPASDLIEDIYFYSPQAQYLAVRQFYLIKNGHYIFSPGAPAESEVCYKDLKNLYDLLLGCRVRGTDFAD